MLVSIASRIADAEIWIIRQSYGWVITDNWRKQIATAAIEVFDDLRTERPGERPNENEFRQRVETKLRQAGVVPAWILIVIAQFLLGKLLEWLWDNWTDEVDS